MEKADGGVQFATFIEMNRAPHRHLRMKLTGLAAACLFLIGLIYFHFSLGRYFLRPGMNRNLTTLMLGPPDARLILKPTGDSYGEGRCGFEMTSYETTDRLVISNSRHPVAVLVYRLSGKTAFLAFFGDEISVPPGGDAYIVPTGKETFCMGADLRFAESVSKIGDRKWEWAADEILLSGGLPIKSHYVVVPTSDGGAFVPVQVPFTVDSIYPR